MGRVSALRCDGISHVEEKGDKLLTPLPHVWARPNLLVAAPTFGGGAESSRNSHTILGLLGVEGASIQGGHLVGNAQSCHCLAA